MYDVMGGTVDEPDPETMRRALGGLAQADDEHPDVSLSHESGWCLSAFRGGLSVWENPDDDSVAPGEMRDADREETLRLCGLLAVGDIESIEALPWPR
ncbi:hypothetical protein ABZY16_32500 [Streptomyces sp. NPDC006553]|uniref:hypothetical protein n=1 Tax=unclassified Streptomyces TaxID=2593676 RepID=UPI00224FF547|nr:hypothetical protein [Streptomyces sp. NBC_00233]MCX5232492.1 hypothetical protein [Streptomyces sp. NBC_00233]